MYHESSFTIRTGKHAATERSNGTKEKCSSFVVWLLNRIRHKAVIALMQIQLFLVSFTTRVGNSKGSQTGNHSATMSWPPPILEHVLWRFAPCIWRTEGSRHIWQICLCTDYSEFNAALWHTLLWHHHHQTELDWDMSQVRWGFSHHESRDRNLP